MFITQEQKTMIKKFLKKRSMTQTELAYHCNTRPQVICNYLAGRKAISKNHAPLLAKILPVNKREFKKGNFVLRKTR